MLELLYLCIGDFSYKYPDSVLTKSLSFESKIYQPFGVLSTALISLPISAYYPPTKFSRTNLASHLIVPLA